MIPKGSGPEPERRHSGGVFDVGGFWYGGGRGEAVVIKTGDPPHERCRNTAYFRKRRLLPPLSSVRPVESVGTEGWIRVFILLPSAAEVGRQIGTFVC